MIKIGFFLCLFHLVSFSLANSSEILTLGIDISHHQGAIEWNLLKTQGVKFVYIKATEGQSFRDSMFSANITIARENGLCVGAYHYFTFCTPGEEQFKNYYKYVPVTAGDLPPVVDVEFVGNCRKRPAVDSLHRELDRFLELTEEHYGVIPIIYTTEDFYFSYNMSRYKKKGHAFWVRSIRKKPTFIKSGHYLIWQFHIGEVDGIEKMVDLNFLMTDLDQVPRVRDKKIR